jgi:dCMP deaminase
MEKKQTYKRPSWDEYFMEITKIVGNRATCNRGRNGCVITKDKRIISTGYTGSPIGLPHCDDIGHEMHTVTHLDGHQSRHCIRTTHAEQNAICQAARFGVSLNGSTLYAKMTPCYTCAKMIINSGITRVVCDRDYHGSSRSKDIFAEAGVQFKLINNIMTTYEDMSLDYVPHPDIPPIKEEDADLNIIAEEIPF